MTALGPSRAALGLCRALSIGIFCLGSTLAGRALAAEPTAAEIAVARRLFREATDLRNARKWADCAAKLREAIAIKETPGLRFHLAHCEEKLGHLVEAKVEYDRADELVQGGASATDVEALLGPAKSALEERVPTLRVRAPRGVSGLALSIDGRPVAATLALEPIPLNPGQHTLDVSATGYLPSTIEVELREGEDRSIDAELRAVPALAARSAAPEQAKKSSPRARERPRETSHSGLGAREFVLMGEGILTLAGLATGVYGLSRGSDAGDRVDAANQAFDRDSRTNGTECEAQSSSLCRELASAIDDEKTAKDLTVAGFVGAGVGAAALVTTWILWRPADGSKSARADVLVLPESSDGAGVGAAVRVNVRVRGSF